MGEHLTADGKFQSDKFPTTPAGLVPLSTADPMAQDLLREYARRRRQKDATFSEDLDVALKNDGYGNEGVWLGPPLYQVGTDMVMIAVFARRKAYVYEVDDVLGLLVGSRVRDEFLPQWRFSGRIQCGRGEHGFRGDVEGRSGTRGGDGEALRCAVPVAAAEPPRRRRADLTGRRYRPVSSEPGEPATGGDNAGASRIAPASD